MYTLCFAKNLWSMMLLLLDCWWIHDQLVLLLWIHAMGIHNYGICGEIWVVLESFTKNGWIGDLWWSYVFDPSFIWIWVSFYVYKRLDKLWGRIWVLGNQNWGFWVKMEVFPESIVAEFCHNSPWRAHGELEASFVCVNSPWRVKCLPWRVA